MVLNPMTINVAEYAVWLQQLQLGDQCSLAFVRWENLNQFRVVQAEVSKTPRVGDSHLDVVYRDKRDELSVWINRELGTGECSTTLVFVVPRIEVETVTVSNLRYPTALRRLAIHAYEAGWKGLVL